MKPNFLLLLPLLATALSAAEGARSIAFSDSTKPGLVRVHIGQGRVAVIGTDEANVSVISSLSSKDTQTERKDGLRVISTSSGYSLNEKENVIELSAGLDGPGRGVPARFEVRVPRSTSVTVLNSWGGDILVEKIDGDVEIKNLGGEIVLKEVTGGALVETLNGRVAATFPTLPADKPLSFTSINGEVELRVPADARANVRLRTQNGNVLTDFDEDVLVTQSDAMTPSAMEEMSRAAAETARAATETARAAAEAARERLAAVAEEIGKRRENRRNEVARNTDSPEPYASSSATASASASSSVNGTTIAFLTPKPPRPPSIPALSGGKIVHGTLNGGGPEIQIATMNADIILRKQAP